MISRFVSTTTDCDLISPKEYQQYGFVGKQQIKLNNLKHCVSIYLRLDVHVIELDDSK